MRWRAPRQTWRLLFGVLFFLTIVLLAENIRVTCRTLCRLSLRNGISFVVTSTMHSIRFGEQMKFRFCSSYLCAFRSGSLTCCTRWLQENTLRVQEFMEENQELRDSVNRLKSDTSSTFRGVLLFSFACRAVPALFSPPLTYCSGS